MHGLGCNQSKKIQKQVMRERLYFSSKKKKKEREIEIAWNKPELDHLHDSLTRGGSDIQQNRFGLNRRGP